MNPDLIKLLKDIFNIEFKNVALLEEAFTHSSYVNEHRREHLKYNERVEFLGDAVLEIAVSEYLYKNFLELPEGKLTRLRAAVVCEDSFSAFAKECHFDRYIRLGKGEERAGGRERAALLCDLFEAFVGALYLDQGMEKVLEFVHVVIFPKIDAGNFSAIMDYKTRLQEELQKKGEVIIDYRVLSEEGPAHEKQFEIEILADTQSLGKGIGKTKKAAEQAAAQNALEQMKKH